MKLSLVLTFVVLMLLCGMLLCAAGNNKKFFVVETKTVKSTHVEIKKDLQFVPDTFLL